MQNPIHGIHANQTIAFQHDVPLHACFAIAKAKMRARAARPIEVPALANIRNRGKERSEPQANIRAVLVRMDASERRATACFATQEGTVLPLVPPGRARGRMSTS